MGHTDVARGGCAARWRVAGVCAGSATLLINRARRDSFRYRGRGPGGPGGRCSAPTRGNDGIGTPTILFFCRPKNRDEFCKFWPVATGRRLWGSAGVQGLRAISPPSKRKEEKLLAKLETNAATEEEIQWLITRGRLIVKAAQMKMENGFNHSKLKHAKV
jgi:hypothetical protein